MDQQFGTTIPYWANWILYNDGSYDIILENVSLKKDKYRYAEISKLSFKEIKEIRKEFETEILPKIKECIDIVKQKYKGENRWHRLT